VGGPEACRDQHWRRIEAKRLAPCVPIACKANKPDVCGLGICMQARCEVEKRIILPARSDGPRAAVSARSRCHNNPSDPTNAATTARPALEMPPMRKIRCQQPSWAYKSAHSGALKAICWKPIT
jgi:hypothetical protein